MSSLGPIPQRLVLPTFPCVDYISRGNTEGLHLRPPSRNVGQSMPPFETQCFELSLSFRCFVSDLQNAGRCGHSPILGRPAWLSVCVFTETRLQRCSPEMVPVSCLAVRLLLRLPRLPRCSRRYSVVPLGCRCACPRKPACRDVVPRWCRPSCLTVRLLFRLPYLQSCSRRCSFGQQAVRLRVSRIPACRNVVADALHAMRATPVDPS